MNKRYRVITGAIFMYMLIAVHSIAGQKVMISNVPIIGQHPELPTGCEATALTILLNYHGIDVTKEEVARAMPKAPTPTMKDGRLQGESPNRAFIGDPFTSAGFGIYAPAMIKLAEQYVPGRVQDLGGGSFDKVYEALDAGKPVMVWTTIGMLPVQENSRWTDATGQTVIWKTPEHAVVAVGYDDQYIYVNDPYRGAQLAWDRSTFEKIWVDMGSQAFTITKQTTVEPAIDFVQRLDAMIDGIVYRELIYQDTAGDEWIPIRHVASIYSGMKVDYDPITTFVTVTITRPERLPANQSQWLPAKSQTIKQAIPRNVNGYYYVQIQLDQKQETLLTYNTQGKSVSMTYSMIDGRMYVNRQWVDDFYGNKLRG